ncbi:hypothetical protein J4228_01855 [Candidatus Woesearchaeota archaeon]|nr:hypothetical protein [Candidatus Woesearchaeota archaeon]
MEESNNQREWFIDYWVSYMKTHSDKEWSRQQNVLINSMLKSAKQWLREEYLKLKSPTLS